MNIQNKKKLIFECLISVQQLLSNSNYLYSTEKTTLRVFESFLDDVLDLEYTVGYFPLDDAIMFAIRTKNKVHQRQATKF